MAKPVVGHDESGQRWFVYDTDPAWPLCRVLWHRGVREIVLPRHTYRTGELTNPVIPVNIYQCNATDPVVAPLVRRHIRLADCVDYLRNALGTDRRDTV